MKNKKDFNFYKLWIGQSINLLGTQFTLVALPLFALEVLETSEANAALLRGIIFVPYLIFGLLAGALIDIFHRKKVLLICSICQGVLLLSVFILTETNIITFPLLVLQKATFYLSLTARKVKPLWSHRPWHVIH